MIVVDSSAFIEFYGPHGDERAGGLVAEAIETDQVAINGIIQTQVVSLARDDPSFQAMLSDFRAYHWIDLGPREFEEAAYIDRDLKKKGIYVPATLLIVAASALTSRARLYHANPSFDLVAQHSRLDARNLGR